MAEIEPLVTTQWLEDHLGDPSLRVIDMRGYVTTRVVEPGVEEAAYQGAPKEYLAEHIPGAIYLDWTKDIINPDDAVSVQVADPDRFAKVMSESGVGDGTHVVAVDHRGGQFATRLWWALRYYGHDRVSVLDGGMNRWVAEGRPLDLGQVKVEPAVFTARPGPDWRIVAEDLRDRLNTGGFQLVDARDLEQYSGRKRRGPRGGHIPGAINLPREIFFEDSPVGGFRPVDEIRQHLHDRGINPLAPTVAYCNGGVAATVVLFNFFRLGGSQLTNYDGSWNEWGARQELPVEPSKS